MEISSNTEIWKYCIFMYVCFLVNKYDCMSVSGMYEYVCLNACIYPDMHEVCIHVYIYIYIYTYMHESVCVHDYMYTCT